MPYRNGSRRIAEEWICHVRFSNRPVGVKRFQTIHRYSVDVSHGLVLLSGIGTKALPSWDSRTRRNDLLVGLAIKRTAGPRWGNRPAACGWLKILGAALQADGETRSVVTASSIRRRSAAWSILLDWTFRSRRPASALWMTRARSFGK